MNYRNFFAEPKRRNEEQKKRLRRLTGIVLATAQVREGWRPFNRDRGQMSGQRAIFGGRRAEFV